MRKLTIIIFVIVTLFYISLIAKEINGGIDYKVTKDYDVTITTETKFDPDGKIIIHYLAPTDQQLKDYNSINTVNEYYKSITMTSQNQNRKDGRNYCPVMPDNAVINQKRALTKDLIDKAILAPDQVIFP